MKLLILLLVALSSFANIQKALDTNHSIEVMLKLLQKEKSHGNLDAKKLLNSLELYGLLEDVIITGRNSRTAAIKKEKEIIKILKKDLFENYLPSLESVFGKCTGATCLTNTGRGLSLKLPERTLCFPNTDCGFYLCMEDKYQCAKEGSTYFSKLAYPTCSTYQKNIKKGMFSKDGVEWIYTVMVCLQKGLIDECEVGGNCKKKTPKKTCEHITDYTLEFHPSCYVNSGIGVCALNLRDKINVWRTVGKYLTNDERKQAFRVVSHCLLGTKV